MTKPALVATPVSVDGAISEAVETPETLVVVDDLQEDSKPPVSNVDMAWEPPSTDTHGAYTAMRPDAEMQSVRDLLGKHRPMWSKKEGEYINGAYPAGAGVHARSAMAKSGKDSCLVTVFGGSALFVRGNYKEDPGLSHQQNLKNIIEDGQFFRVVDCRDGERLERIQIEEFEYTPFS